MIVSELIKDLQQALEEHGDIQVRLEADHGQTPMTANCTTLGHIDSDSWMAESIHQDDLDKYPEAIPVIIIEAY